MCLLTCECQQIANVAPWGVVSGAGSGAYDVPHSIRRSGRQYRRHGVCVHACDIDIIIYVLITLR
jgi:hypothetical protein